MTSISTLTSDSPPEVVEKISHRKEITDALSNHNLARLEQQRNYTVTQFFGTTPDPLHNLRISNQYVTLSTNEVKSLTSLASTIPAFLNAIGKLAALSILDDKKRRVGKTYRLIRQALGLDKKYDVILKDIKREESRKSLEQDNEGTVMALATEIASEHPICRLDLVKGRDGQFYIAEIEVDKTHGFGYSTLAREFSPHPLGSGLVDEVAKLSSTTTTALLISERERFYIPELRFFTKRVREKGGNIVLLQTNQIVMKDSGLYYKESGGSLKPLYQIIGVPTDSSDLQLQLLHLHQAGIVKLLTVPFPGLGEKATLGLISNPTMDQELEEALVRAIGASDIASLRAHLPTTEIVSKINKHRRTQIKDILEGNSENYFVKSVNESGAKGVASPGDKERQMALLRGKAKKVIIQQAIVPQMTEFSFCDVGTGIIRKDTFSIRYGLFVSNQGKILDLALTASPGLIAHGGPTSILMGATSITD